MGAVAIDVCKQVVHCGGGNRNFCITKAVCTASILNSLSSLTGLDNVSTSLHVCRKPIIIRF